MPDSHNLERKRILFLVLNWGLGHATRSEVLINELLHRGFEVHIASDGDALHVLQKSFPELTFHELPGYGIKYGTGATNLLKLLLQAPTAMGVMKRERKLIQSLHAEFDYDGLISDNRPGVAIESIPSVYITHQLNIKAGLMSKQVSAAHARFYRSFDEVWVPDDPVRSMSGDLSESESSLRVKYIGTLSRLRKLPIQKRIPWAAILSGPEPARSEWESELRAVRNSLPEGGIIVRGKPGEGIVEEGVVDYMNSEELSQLYADAEVIITRSGYSSLMDLVTLGKKALLIPTPGQTEQEYLAVHQSMVGWSASKQGSCDYLKEIEKLRDETAPKPISSALPADLFGLFEREREG
ncbi:glycosyltransferase family protein [Phaeocystidibacter luteus]|uniref:Glycosyltransferase n=1 Tax=Phaeocystidibacter luteus TaxID=911197 RepID=A0A6N6RH54_9FLAO|nr:glycosyltransferase family protein [Phaeocystidibacter luteus]KAB2813696.1 glycosyltransferase [Phaeocystidibacter luteus]